MYTLVSIQDDLQEYREGMIQVFPVNIGNVHVIMNFTI